MLGITENYVGVKISRIKNAQSWLNAWIRLPF